MSIAVQTQSASRSNFGRMPQPIALMSSKYLIVAINVKTRAFVRDSAYWLAYEDLRFRRDEFRLNPHHRGV